MPRVPRAARCGYGHESLSHYHALAAAGGKILWESLRAPSVAQVKATAAATSLPALSQREFFVLHLMHVVGAPAAARLPAAESDLVSMMLEMLDGEWTFVMMTILVIQLG